MTRRLREINGESRHPGEKAVAEVRGFIVLQVAESQLSYTPDAMEKHGKQSCAEGRESGRERTESLNHANPNGKAPNAVKAARLVPDALGEACLRTVALAWIDGEVLLTALVTERRGGECICLLHAWHASHLRHAMLDSQSR